MWASLGLRGNSHSYSVPGSSSGGAAGLAPSCKACPGIFIFPGNLSSMAQWVKNLPAMQETQETHVLPPGESPLEEEMATCSSILA